MLFTETWIVTILPIRRSHQPPFCICSQADSNRSSSLGNWIWMWLESVWLYNWFVFQVWEVQHRSASARCWLLAYHSLLSSTQGRKEAFLCLSSPSSRHVSRNWSAVGRSLSARPTQLRLMPASWFSCKRQGKRTKRYKQINKRLRSSSQIFPRSSPDLPQEPSRNTGKASGIGLGHGRCMLGIREKTRMMID